jgi:protein required for attachment to host cells
MKNWLVIANAAKARVLEQSGTGGVYVHVADLVHPQSRQKGVELATDRPGYVKGSGHGLGSASYVRRTGAREREQNRFAHEVATALNDGISVGRCAGLVLVASNPFLGQLKAHLSEQAHKALLRTVACDYTALPDTELTQRLSTAIGKEF